jgi:hypothetical protein
MLHWDQSLDRDRTFPAGTINDSSGWICAVCKEKIGTTSQNQYCHHSRYYPSASSRLLFSWRHKYLFTSNSLLHQAASAKGTRFFCIGIFFPAVRTNYHAYRTSFVSTNHMAGLSFDSSNQIAPAFMANFGSGRVPRTAVRAVDIRSSLCLGNLLLIRD